ncbi:MAG: tRNA (5-methylaminomethyl-2-thiouridine)(34)-methyltransferase MnmD [Psychroflexus sp.]|jgi:tRNA U34 5-methylaminomethyl-2-thiouridine-forming methyltransferase MnmC|nr:tRNA (5-methylaminomethyl-2-thiouridine)(34)-methyltransferase MnmD [Psychroflexus sp.]MDR9448933.1 tRNA (5-methylaminomethyl-2-thiouridine)(34)-methyltransferase MnmD [Psychroflexus sp.]
MENRQIVKTKDGSSSLYLPDLDEYYHSSHGAVQESAHVFIDHGFCRLIESKDEFNLLEVGFGTGLNAFLTLQQSLKKGKRTIYSAIEPYPLSLQEVDQFNYQNFVDESLYQHYFRMLHELSFDQLHKINDYFQLIKYQDKLLKCQLSKKFDLVYYDAFGPRAQPEMWELSSLEKTVNSLKEGGIFVTYCVKGSVKRALKSLGMQVDKLPGPPGKREMLFATLS